MQRLNSNKENQNPQPIPNNTLKQSQGQNALRPITNYSYDNISHNQNSPSTKLSKQKQNDSITTAPSISPRCNKHHDTTNTFTQLSTRQVLPLISIENAKSATTEVLRNTIAHATDSKIDQKIIFTLQYLLGLKEDATFEEIMFSLERMCTDQPIHRKVISRFEKALNVTDVTKTCQALKLLAKISEKNPNGLEKTMSYYHQTIDLSPQSQEANHAREALIEIYFTLNCKQNYRKGIFHFCYQILDSDKATQEQKMNALYSLANLFINDSTQLLKLIEFSLQIGLFDCAIAIGGKLLTEKSFSIKHKIDTASHLASIFIFDQKDTINLNILINKINNLIRQSNATEKIYGFQCLFFIYIKLNNNNKSFDCFNSIIEIIQINKIYTEVDLFCEIIDTLKNHQKNQEAIKYCKYIIDRKGLFESYKIDALCKLSELLDDINHKIQCLENICLIPEATIEHKFYARESLTRLYLDSNNTDKAIEYYKELVKTDFSIERDLIIAFFKNPHCDLINQLALINNLNPEIQNTLWEILMQHPGLWYGKYKLNHHQWNAISQCKVDCNQLLNFILELYMIFPIDRYSTIEYPQNSFSLNQLPFLKNNNHINNWNILPQIELEITSDIWDQALDNLQYSFDRVSHTYKNKDEKKSLQQFTEKCLQARDDNDKQRIAKHIIAVIDIIKNYVDQLDTKDPELSEIEKDKIITIIRGAIDIIIQGGKSCADNAIEALHEVENYLKTFKNPQYKANVFINMFKSYSIQYKLALKDKTHLEQLETQRYYSMKLDSILGLRTSDTSMLFIDHAKILPLEEALSILCEAFTAQNLINFTIGSHIFSMIFDLNEDPILKMQINNLALEYDNAFDIDDKNEQYEKEQGILNQINQLKNSFYIQKAVQMYLDAGFLIPAEIKTLKNCD